MKKLRLFVLMLVLMMGMSICAEAKVVRDADGNITIYKHGQMQKGWFRYHGKWRYGHQSKSMAYPEGSVTRSEYREENGRLYYMRNDGSLQTRSSHYIKVNRDHSVRYIYIPGTGKRERYNCKHHRYQIKRKGRWRDVGMECFPMALVDWQW